MSYRSSGSTFAGSMASDESYIGNLPIVSLLEDIDAYAGNIFDLSAKTVHDLQRAEQVKRDRAEFVDWRKLDEREVLLTGFLRRIEEVQEKLTDMRRADFAALSLVWNNNSELMGQSLQGFITLLAGIERQVKTLRDNFDGQGHSRPDQIQSEAADELFARHKSMVNTESNTRAITHRREVHPCRGGLQLIRDDDRGGIDRCLKKDLTFTELDRLSRGGIRGTYLFWKCDSCEFRIKYFVSKSRAASLLNNDDHLAFRNSQIRCSRAFLAMSHLEQREGNRLSSSLGPPRYTCMLCALHRPAVRFGRTHTFPNRDEYARHIEDTHLGGSPPPKFVLQKLRIDDGEGLPDGRRAELWIA